METPKINILIVDDDKAIVAALKQYLDNKFGLTVKISTFYDGESCLAEIDDRTHVVLLDYFLNEKNGLEVLKDIKNINPKTEVIMLSSYEDIATAIESIRRGATSYIVKGEGSWKKIKSQINRIITVPTKSVAREVGVLKFTILFFLTFFIMSAMFVWVWKITS